MKPWSHWRRQSLEDSRLSNLFSGEPIKTYFLIKFRERETRGGVWHILWGGWKRLLIACSYTYDGATEAQDTVPLLWSTLDVLTYLKSNDKYCLNFSNKFNAHVYWQIMINVIFKVLLPHWEEKHCRLTKSCTGNWSLETTGEPPNGTASQER